MTWRVDGGAPRSERWSPWLVDGQLELLPPSGSELTSALLSSGQSISLNIAGASAISTTLDLSALQATPVFDNFAACGAGTSVLIGDTEVRIQAFLHQDDSDTGRRASSLLSSDGARTVRGANGFCRAAASYPLMAKRPPGCRRHRSASMSNWSR